MDGHVESADGPPLAPHNSETKRASRSLGVHSPPTSDRVRDALSIREEAAKLAKARFDGGILMLPRSTMAHRSPIIHDSVLALVKEG